MKKLIAVWGVAMLSILGASLWYLYGPGTAPEGQPPLLTISASNLSRVQTEFNAASDRVRILAVVSPTKADTLQAASVLQQLLSEFEGSPVLAQVIWEPQVDTDWAPPATEVMARVWDTRAKQYWDKSHAISQRTGKSQILIFSRGATWHEDLPPAGMSVESASGSIAALRTFLKAVLPPTPNATPVPPTMATHWI